MSLCPEAAAFLGTPRVTMPATKSVRLLTGNEPREELAADLPKFITTNEDTMTNTTEAVKPKRKYTRRQPKLVMSLDKAEPAAKKKPGPKTKALGVVFSIDSTGSLLIRRGDHSMEFSSREVNALQEFIDRAQSMWMDRTENGAVV